MRLSTEILAIESQIHAWRHHLHAHPETAFEEQATADFVVGETNVETGPMPEMGSEDFAFMLQAKRGCNVLLGAGHGESTANVHNPRYDFNDAALPIGAGYWVTLVEHQLPRTN